MRPAVTIELGGVQLAASHRTVLCQMQHRIFSSPPFVSSARSVQEQEAVFDGLLESQDFSICLARCDRRVVGFAYGHCLPVDHLWWHGFPFDIPHHLSAEWEGRTFTLVDLAVGEGFRRQGLGSRLVSGLFSSRYEERALLSTQPAAKAAHAFYRATGWRLIGRKGPIKGVVPPYWDIYLRRIRQAGPSCATEKSSPVTTAPALARATQFCPPPAPDLRHLPTGVIAQAAACPDRHGKPSKQMP
jgi:ribosomal protein S18 acetylase RimI-like enzyme